MDKVICDYCGNVIGVFNSIYMGKDHKYCSKNCRYYGLLLRPIR